MLTLKVTDMECAHCADTITRALAAIPGATHVAVDLAAATVSIEGNPNPQAVADAITHAGYTLAA